MINIRSTRRKWTADWILDNELAPVWVEVAQQETTVFIFPKAEQLSMIATLAERYPDVSLVVDHMTFSDGTTTPNTSPWADFETVADHDSVAVKLSSLPRSSEEGWPYEDLWGYVRNLADWSGTECLLLGSDYPWMDDWAGHEEWVEEVPFLSARDYSYLVHKTFKRVHRV